MTPRYLRYWSSEALEKGVIIQNFYGKYRRITELFENITLEGLAAGIDSYRICLVLKIIDKCNSEKLVRIGPAMSWKSNNFGWNLPLFWNEKSRCLAQAQINQVQLQQDKDIAEPVFEKTEFEKLKFEEDLRNGACSVFGRNR